MSSTLLVTGGTGFIGFWTIVALSEHADIDAGRGQPGDLSMGKREELRRLWHVNHLPKQARALPRKVAASFAQETWCAAGGSSRRAGQLSRSHPLPGAAHRLLRLLRLGARHRQQSADRPGRADPRA